MELKSTRTALDNELQKTSKLSNSVIPDLERSVKNSNEMVVNLQQELSEKYNSNRSLEESKNSDIQFQTIRKEP